MYWYSVYPVYCSDKAKKETAGKRYPKSPSDLKLLGENIKKNAPIPPLENGYCSRQFRSLVDMVSL
jgi:hypothetical protein